MRGPLRLTRYAVAVAFLTGVLLPAAPASAHPLGNFSVNQYAALTLTPHGVRVSAVINTAEIPTRQERTTVDANADGRISGTESAAYTGVVCRDLAAQFRVNVAGHRLAWRTTPGELTYQPGAAGLSTARLTCTLVGDAGLEQSSTVTVANLYRADRLGWNELTAVGDGLHLVDSPLPQRSPSNELRTFPASESPATLSRVRTATLHTVPGTAPAPVAAPTKATDRPLAAATGWAQGHFERLAAGRLSPIVVILAILLALLLGAGHAVLPGHGKTAFAAYLAGRDGRPRDAVTIGVAVTLSHTGSVLVVGLLITAGTAFATEQLLGYLGVASGLLVIAVGCAMLVNVVRRHHQPGHSHAGYSHGEAGDSLALVGALAIAHPGSAIGQAPGEHTHADHADDHSHRVHAPGGHVHAHKVPTRSGGWSLAGLGLAGGLVPSPSALIVLLAAVGLGRAVFGIVLVVAYGIGMAGTLTAAGLLLLALRRRIATVDGRLARFSSTVSALVPVTAAALVVVVGAGLTLRAMTGLV